MVKSRVFTDDTSLATPEYAMATEQPLNSYLEDMQDISRFLNTVGLDFELNFETILPAQPLESDNHGHATSSAPSEVDSNSRSNEQPDSPDETDSITSTPKSATNGAISSEVAIDSAPALPATSGLSDYLNKMKVWSRLWKVNEVQRQKFDRFLTPFRSSLGEFSLPSRLSMARYIAGFVDGFSHHHPFIHMPTFKITRYHQTPELVLALMAIGAQYRYEHQGALALYRAGRAIILHRQREGYISRNILAMQSRASSAEDPDPGMGEDFAVSNHINILGASLLLAKFACWQRDKSLVRQSLEYQYFLAQCIRDTGLSEAEPEDGDDWQIWAQKETARRTKLCAFCFLNLQSLIFNLPPVILSNEIHLRLPTSCKEWLAEGQEQWLQSRAEALKIVSFQDALVRLLSPSDEPKDVLITSPFGNYILIHALLQRLFMSWQFSINPSGGSAHIHNPSHVELSLSKWKVAWQQAPESVLDLKNSKGSLSWSAISMLALAHVRAHFDLGNYRQFLCGEPESIARAAQQSRHPRRGVQLRQAIIHSAHSLNIPIQLGVAYLSNCQAFFWSIQHSVCFFECAVFLSKWLWSLALDKPDYEESQLLGWIWTIVAEASDSIHACGEIVDPEARPSSEKPISALTLKRLSISVVEIFSRMFKASNSVWPFVLIIGESLEKFARLMREEIES